MSFDKILIANRGEIALRVIEACRELGIRSIAAYSEADADMPYLELADAAVCVGPAQPAKSYLNVPSLISAAELIGASAIHPGYGFLSENPHFVEVCEEHGIAFIGPSAETMRLLGDKAAARDAVKAAGVPVLPGMRIDPDCSDDLVECAGEIGYPVLLKAVYGGGGRGMRLIASEADLVAAASAASAEAKAACGDGSLYLEKAVDDPRHIEVQILADGKGNVVHLGERDCSVQRRHQKLVEESPAPRLADETREHLTEAALCAARAVQYENAGTVEFVVDNAGAFHFIEMNARIQVEHSVSEVVSRRNLIKDQIRIAAGDMPRLEQAGVILRGHAIECRLNAEDPDRGFLPSSGTVSLLEMPGGNGIRVDTILYDGMPMTAHYDSLLAKLIAWGEDRAEACERLSLALRRFRVGGVATTRDVLLRIVNHPQFRDGGVSTRFVDRMLQQ